MLFRSIEKDGKSFIGINLLSICKSIKIMESYKIFDAQVQGAKCIIAILNNSVNRKCV